MEIVNAVNRMKGITGVCRKLSLLILFILCLNFSDCGVYGFRGNNPPPGINSIAVPTFKDVSGFSAPDLAEGLTQQLKSKITSDNTFRVADKNIADAVLNCTVTSVRDEALVVSSGETVTRRKITVTVTVDFENLKKQKKIWDKTFENFGEYESSNDAFSQRANGLLIATERITEDIINDLTSNW
ncbi:MAG TPA: LPS assembly lipoprotein LptE [Ignavibacteria bacterium]|nr:LPS assembly lipoprotein LptE [Ignavibacteria bacterium]HMR40009.1 LPS assembly lipoprotein LptE [Ignavibacteria bacterium]